MPGESVSFPDTAGVLSQLTNTYNTFIMNLLSVYIYFMHLYRIDDDVIDMGYVGVNVKYIKGILNNDELRQSVLNEYSKSSMRAFFTDTFDVFNAFVTFNNMEEDVNKNDWFRFAKIVRKAMSPYTNFAFIFDKEDETILPVTFKGATISKDMNGSYISISFVSHEIIMDLYSSYSSYVSHFQQLSPRHRRNSPPSVADCID